MKVIIITNYFLPVKGGIENHCYNLTKELLKKGIEVEIHTSKNIFSEKNVLESYEIMDGIKVFRHKNFWKFVPEDCDIIHLHNFNIFPHFWIFLKNFTKRLFKMKAPRLVITLHGGFTPWWKEFSGFGRIIKLIYHKTLGKFFLNHVVDKIIAVSEWEKEQLIREGISNEKIVVIPNGVEELAYTLPKVENSNLEKYKPYLLFIGRISRRKNLDFVIRCLKKINKIKFLIAGSIHEKEYYEYLNNLISELRLQNKILFLGEVDEKFKYVLIDNALSVVLVSHNETEPIIIKEAMVREKPVIASNIDPLKFLIKNGENGFIISDENDFINAVKKLMQNKELVEKIAENNRKLSEKWRWSNIANNILKIYKVVLKL